MKDDLATIERDIAEDGTVLIRLKGEVDLSNVEQLQQRLAREAHDAPGLVIDLTAIDYIDSQGLRLLNRLSRTLAARGSTLHVVAPPGSVARSVLDLTGMSDELTLRDDPGS
jgi:anti-anti-sigma factor